MDKKKILILAVLVIVIGALAIWYSHSTQNASTQIPDTQTTSTDAEHTTSYISNVISAIASYRASTEEATLVAQQYTDKGVDLNNRDVKTAEELAVLMKISNDFKNGNAYLNQYLNDNNQIISLSAKAINQSATSILQPNEDMLAAFQAGDTQKEQVALAADTAAQDEGTNNMLEVMPIITQGLIFGLGPNDTVPASGSIHSPLSLEQRNQLLAQIKNNFPDGVSNYSHDIYSLMVYGLQMALVSNTFEQWHNIGSAATASGAPALPFTVSQN